MCLSLRQLHWVAGWHRLTFINRYTDRWLPPHPPAYRDQYFQAASAASRRIDILSGTDCILYRIYVFGWMLGCGLVSAWFTNICLYIPGVYAHVQSSPRIYARKLIEPRQKLPEIVQQFLFRWSHLNVSFLHDTRVTSKNRDIYKRTHKNNFFIRIHESSPRSTRPNRENTKNLKRNYFYFSTCQLTYNSHYYASLETREKLLFVERAIVVEFLRGDTIFKVLIE